MGLMDKVKAKATVLAQKTQETAREGKAKFDQVQATRRADAMLRNLGALVYADRTGRGTPDSQPQIDRLIADISAHEAANGINLSAEPTDMGAQMLERGAGSIVNVASIAGLTGIGHRCAYNASKHGLIGLTRTLAAEWGGRGVRVNAVCPGWIKTEMDTADQGSGAYSDRDIIDRVPLARFARPEDVASAIAFLADAQRSSFVNGVSLPVDGGWLADGSWETLRLGMRMP
jgi:NAD(P)-dependent dehydrogenase (short-subunit alcohol dehydrogenase family)